MNDCGIPIELAQIFVRCVLLFMVSIGGCLSIFLGWRLYKDSIISKVDGEFNAGDIKIRISAAGPGIVLAGFGAYLLLSVSQHRFESTTEIARPQSQAMPGNSYSRLEYNQTEKQNTHLAIWQAPVKTAAKKQPDLTAKNDEASKNPSHNCVLYRKITSNISGEDVVDLRKLQSGINSARKIIREKYLQNDASNNEDEISRQAIRSLNIIDELINESMELKK
jgi:hypothetical protein